MPRKQLATVEEVGTRLEEWRQSRRHQRTAIPDELWSAAIEVARRDGLGRIAAALRLDYGKLKRLMLAADGAEENGDAIFYGIDRARRQGDCAMRDRNGGPAREDPDRT